MHEKMKEICSLGPIIPVIEIDDAELALPMAEALLRGGVRVIEVTLRTPQALDAIRAISDHPDLAVGAGTLLSSADAKDAKSAGATFGVSPGASPDLVNACNDVGLPFLPGAATPGEVIGLREKGLRILKFFPAEAAGGVSMLKGMAGPFTDIKFCPTGGVSKTNALDYLSLPNVICAGGSWVAPRNLIAEKAWDQIEANARFASALSP